MLKTLLKHMLLEQAIRIFFEQVDRNFTPKLPPPDWLRDVHIEDEETGGIVAFFDSDTLELLCNDGRTINIDPIVLHAIDAEPDPDFHEEMLLEVLLDEYYSDDDVEFE